MNKHRLSFCCAMLLLCGWLPGDAAAPPLSESSQPPVRLGVEVLFEKRLELVRGRRVALITNPTGIDSHLDSVVELFRAHPEVKLVALAGPEHGVRGNFQAGENPKSYLDEHWHLPVFDLYRPSGEAPAITAQITVPMDVVVFDLQDAGCRTYTYLETMASAMSGCAAAKIPFLVLDRPNPINGATMEGPVLDYPAFHSSVGVYPIPLRHGMTVGELAQLFNDRFLKTKADLIVVPMENWNREAWFDQTGLPWVMPSPNLPTLDTATVYPGQVLLEGTSVSEGRGTTRPFELFGAPWVDGFVLAAKLNELRLPGVKFREAWFTPTFSKFSGKLCGGCQLHIVNRSEYRSVTTALAELAAIRDLYGDKLEFQTSLFDKLAGTSAVREALQRGEPAAKIAAGFQSGLNAFARLREPYLIYH